MIKIKTNRQMRKHPPFLLCKYANKSVLEHEPKEYVSENEDRGDYEENENTGSGMIPDQLPVPRLYKFYSLGYLANDSLPDLAASLFNLGHKICHYKKPYLSSCSAHI